MRNRELNLATAQLQSIIADANDLLRELEEAHEAELGTRSPAGGDGVAVSGGGISDPTAQLALSGSATRARNAVRSALKSVAVAGIELARARASLQSAWRAADSMPHVVRPSSCQTCGGDLGDRSSECQACYSYRARTGNQRPGHLIEAALNRG